MPCCGDDTHCQDWACAVQLKQNYSFRPGPATPCLKTGRADGGQKSSKLLRKINTEKVLGFLKPNFRVYNTSSFKNVESVQGLVSPEGQARGCLAQQSSWGGWQGNRRSVCVAAPAPGRPAAPLSAGEPSGMHPSNWNNTELLFYILGNVLI